MYFSDKITLRKVTTGIDSSGFASETYTDTVAWSDKRTPSMNEFYKANEIGMEVVAVFVVHNEDYDNQRRVIHGSDSYEVKRTYYHDANSTGLVCSNKAV